ncbi:MAG: putative molybdenum carrier protein [Thermodesulfobacteriota bacterium]|nr:putative molybdenum carrier protein [Thermodesulfobacteriota bacterium]
MIKKIISGGQTGADRAALDTAIKFNLFHGGWVPACRKAEDGRLSDRYHMDEMPTDSYPMRTEQNILDSRGTLIISRGRLTKGSLLTQNLAAKLKKPCCHIDLLKMDEFEAAIIVNSFVADYSIDVINIAGPRASSDPDIYRSVKAVLETIIYMGIMESDPEDLALNHPVILERKPEKKCGNIADSVAFLAKKLPLKTRSFIANSDDVQTAFVYFTLTDYIRVKLDLDRGNRSLMKECAEKLGGDTVYTEDAVMVIIKALKACLEKNHVLRIVR